LGAAPPPGRGFPPRPPPPPPPDLCSFCLLWAVLPTADHPRMVCKMTKIGALSWLAAATGLIAMTGHALASVAERTNSSETRERRQTCNDFSGIYDDTPHWSGGVMTQSGCTATYAGRPRDGWSASLSGSRITWTSGTGNANAVRGTINGDVITWDDGNTWERRPGANSGTELRRRA